MGYDVFIYLGLYICVCTERFLGITCEEVHG